jgi:hypothetical protein
MNIRVSFKTFLIFYSDCGHDPLSLNTAVGIEELKLTAEFTEHVCSVTDSGSRRRHVCVFVQNNWNFNAHNPHRLPSVAAVCGTCISVLEASLQNLV